MSLGVNKSGDLVAGYVGKNPTNFGSTTLTTSAVKATLCAVTPGQIRRVRVVNLTATTNRVGIGFVAKGAAAPTLSADPANANAGVVLGPLQEIYFSMNDSLDLYVIGSAASTAVQVTSYPV